MKKRVEKQPGAGPVFTRVDPAALAKFDPNTKVCTMNCGRHRDDPRSYAERKFLCDDCSIIEPRMEPRTYFDTDDYIRRLREALDAAESILRYCPLFNTNCGGTKPTMTTERAHQMVKDALALRGSNNG